jgi:hypothetical protein
VKEISPRRTSSTDSSGGLNFGRHLVKHKLKCVLFSAFLASKTQVLGIRKNLLSVIVGPIISLGKVSHGIVLTRFKQCSRILLVCIFIAVTSDSANGNSGLITVPILHFLVFETLLFVKAKWIDDEGTIEHQALDLE